MVEQPEYTETSTDKIMAIAMMHKRNRNLKKDGDKKWRRLIPSEK